MEKILTGRERQELKTLRAIAAKPQCGAPEMAMEMPPVRCEVRDAVLEAFDFRIRQNEDPFAVFDFGLRRREEP